MAVRDVTRPSSAKQLDTHGVGVRGADAAAVRGADVGIFIRGEDRIGLEWISCVEELDARTGGGVGCWYEDGAVMDGAGLCVDNAAVVRDDGTADVD